MMKMKRKLQPQKLKPRLWNRPRKKNQMMKKMMRMMMKKVVKVFVFIKNYLYPVYLFVSSWSVQFLKLFSLCLKIRICNRVSVEIAGKYCQTNKIVWVSPWGKFCSIFSIFQIIASLWLVGYFLKSCCCLVCFKLQDVHASLRCICVASFNFLAFVILFV